MRWLIVLILLSLPAVPAFSQGKRRKPTSAAPPASQTEKPAVDLQKLDAAATEARDNLITATQNYQDSLEKLLAYYTETEQRASELVEKRRRLFALGVLARRELDESEEGLKAAQEKTAEVRKQISEAQQMMAEVIVAEEEAKKAIEARNQVPQPARSGLVMVRYTGLSNWSLSDAAQIETFFQTKFGRSLPVSAWGQTGTHAQLGFDHRNAFDVALHPDSSEGRALMDYLRSQGVPFIAFRAAVPGSATGVHIHIGPPSHRLSVTSR